MEKVRAKFKYNSYTTTIEDSYPDWKSSTECGKKVQVEKRTLNFTPVYGGNDASHENKKFWEYTPSGSLQLGTINQNAWGFFVLGKEYYLDFTEAPDTIPS